MISIAALSYNKDMVCVELDGTLGIVGWKADILLCYVCNMKTCCHVEAVRRHSDHPVIKDFSSVSPVAEKRYAKKCLSKESIPYKVTPDYSMKIRCHPSDYLNQVDGIFTVGQQKCCDIATKIIKSALQPLYCRDYVVMVRGMVLRRGYQIRRK